MNHHAKAIGVLALIIFLVAISFSDASYAFRSTKQESYTDPDYLDYQPKTVVVQVVAENFEARQIIEERLTADLEKRGIKVYLHNELFPPTRDWDDAKRREIFERYSIEAGIVVGVGASSQQIAQVGSYTSGSATATSSGSSSTAYGSSTTTPIISASSNAAFSGLLIDLSENRIAWTSDIYTKASGTLFVGGKGDAKAAAKGIIDGLIEDNHLAKKKRK
jgi:hypothetical protein